MELDLEPKPLEAKRFLKALAGTKGEKFFFQTFLADKDGKKKCIRKYFGRFSEFESIFVGLNKERHGIFVTVNVHDGGPTRLAENIIGLRSLFVDSDDGPVTDFRIKPSAVIQTKRGDHVYWFLNENENIENFSYAQKCLINNLKTDPNALSSIGDGRKLISSKGKSCSRKCFITSSILFFHKDRLSRDYLL